MYPSHPGGSGSTEADFVFGDTAFADAAFADALNDDLKDDDFAFGDSPQPSLPTGISSFITTLLLHESELLPFGDTPNEDADTAFAPLGDATTTIGADTAFAPLGDATTTIGADATANAPALALADAFSSVDFAALNFATAVLANSNFAVAAGDLCALADCAAAVAAIALNLLAANISLVFAISFSNAAAFSAAFADALGDGTTTIGADAATAPTPADAPFAPFADAFGDDGGKTAGGSK